MHHRLTSAAFNKWVLVNQTNYLEDKHADAMLG